MGSVPLFRRACGLVLLVLALLPVTAPFSTVNLVDLFHGVPADGSSLQQQGKTGGDKPVPEALHAIDLAYFATGVAVRPEIAVRALQAPHLLDIPLRL